MDIKQDILDYQPFNQQEYYDRLTILKMLDEYDDIFERSNLLAHMTSSCWLTNKSHDKVLMCFHRIYNSWSWLGGHCDGDKDTLRVALKEASEESGLRNIVPISTDIFSLEILSVDSHIKNGQYVPTHLHLNVTYLLEGDEKEKLHHKDDENKAVAWYGLDEAIAKSNEEWFKKNIYTKLNAKLKELA